MQKLTYFLIISLSAICTSITCNGTDTDEFSTSEKYAQIEIEYLTKEDLPEKLAQEEEKARKYREEQARLIYQLIDQQQKAKAKDPTPQEEQPPPSPEM